MVHTEMGRKIEGKKDGVDMVENSGQAGEGVYGMW